MEKLPETTGILGATTTWHMQLHARRHRRQALLGYGPPVPCESTDSSGALETALELHHAGLRLVPLAGKVAVVRNWPVLRLGERDIRSWSRRGVNFGILTGDPL